jgi:hypothetical protein
VDSETLEGLEMRASELIKLLADGIATYGDSNVWVLDGGRYVRPDKISHMSDQQGNKFAIMSQTEGKIEDPRNRRRK